MQTHSRFYLSISYLMQQRGVKLYKLSLSISHNETDPTIIIRRSSETFMHLDESKSYRKKKIQVLMECIIVHLR